MLILFDVYLQKCKGFGRFWLFLHRYYDQAKWRSQGESGSVTVLHSVIGVRINSHYSPVSCIYFQRHTEIVHIYYITHTPFISIDYSHKHAHPNLLTVKLCLGSVSFLVLGCQFTFLLTPLEVGCCHGLGVWKNSVILSFPRDRTRARECPWYRWVMMGIHITLCHDIVDAAAFDLLQCITAFRVVGLNPIRKVALLHLAHQNHQNRFRTLSTPLQMGPSHASLWWMVRVPSSSAVFRWVKNVKM